MGLTGTCKLQICRSTGPWSLGTLGHVEHSIQNAYVEGVLYRFTWHHDGPCFSNPKFWTFRLYWEPILHHLVSDHLNSSTIASIPARTVINETKIENGIGDALFTRIMRANRDNTPWKCCIVIPLLPGFTFPVDHIDASAVNLISQGLELLSQLKIASHYTRWPKSQFIPGTIFNILSAEERRYRRKYQ